MAVYRKKQPARRPVRRGWKRHARTGMFLFAFALVAVTVGREDLSASIFQAVVNQTISGLACGKPIRGHVAFLGGPLHFLSELKAAFIRTLNRIG